MKYEGQGAMDKALASSKTGEAFLVINPDDSEVVFDSWAEAETYRAEPYRAARPVAVKPSFSAEEQERRYKAQCERLERARAAKRGTLTAADGVKCSPVEAVFPAGEPVKPNLVAAQQALFGMADMAGLTAKATQVNEGVVCLEMKF